MSWLETKRIPIGLVSDMSQLQNAILIEQLEEKLEVKCKMLPLEKATDCGLALLDCNELQLGDIHTVLHRAQKEQVPLTIALINVTTHGPYEHLIRWNGINGVFYRNTDQHQLITGIRKILDGEYWLPRRLLNDYLRKNRKEYDRTPTRIKLTHREKQILQCIENGATNSEIAQLLFISEHTVKSHLYNLYKKIGVKNRIEAIKWVLKFL